MSMPSDSSSLRRSVYALLIVVALSGILGRILSVNNVYEPYLSRSDPGQTSAAILAPLAAASAPEAAVLLTAGRAEWVDVGADEPTRRWPAARPEPMPTLGGNDRSRWATIRALVDHGTYAIGERTFSPAGEPRDQGIVTDRGWETLDKVLHPETRIYYSSKPPLLPTMVAGEYWVLKHLLGWSIIDREQRWLVVRTILVTVNWLPLLLYLVLLARLVERYGVTDWGRLYVVAAGAFATLMTPFAIVLNNHTIGAWSALFALYPALQVVDPSAALPGRRSPLPFVLAGLFAGFAACCELPAAAFLAGLFLLLLARAPGPTLAYFVPAAALPVAGLLLTNFLAIGEIAPAYSKLLSEWYQYEGSYWRPDPAKRGIDWAWQRESKLDYAFHLLLGHHGLFSLSPIWLLAGAGVLHTLFHREERSWSAIIFGRVDGQRDAARVLLAALTLFLSVVVLGFYLLIAARMSNNYGGWTCGPRWFLWLTPLWLLALLPAADFLASRRWGRVLGYVFLGLSVLSVSYPAWNPWRHPWIYNWMEAQGWIRY
jgi:hypothetical protein